MKHYILRRLMLMVPTLFGIMVLNFIFVQWAPGGPVEQMIATLTGTGSDASQRFTGAGAGDTMGASTTATTSTTLMQGADSGRYRGAQGLDPELIAKIEKLYGMDKPPITRFFQMIGNYLTFNLGESFFRSASVIDLVWEKLPVSISLGLWTTLIVYSISIPLGIRKAVRDGSNFDVNTSFVIIIGYAIPSLLFAVLLIVLFAGGSFLDLFPLRGLTSQGWELMPWYMKVLDYFWHLFLPVTAMVIGGFASLTMMTKNFFLEEIGKQYVLTARAKGCSERQVLYGHVFRNAMLLIIAGFPRALLGILFTSAFIIEIVFSLDGLGLLGFEAAMQRDYPVMFGTLYVFTLMGLILSLMEDVTYALVDPRIDFSRQKN